MASTTLRLVDYDFQRFQDGFDCSFDYRLVDYDFKKFARCARPVPFIKVFISACPFIKSLRKNSALRAAISLYKSLYDGLSLHKRAYKQFPRCARPFFLKQVFINCFSLHKKQPPATPKKQDLQEIWKFQKFPLVCRLVD